VGEQVISFTLLGQPHSKANSRRLVRWGNRIVPIKSAKAVAYAKSVAAQCPKLPVLLDGDLWIELHIFYASRRPDLDESVILDSLQGLIYINDRQIKVKHVYWGLDKQNPRSEIKIGRIEAGKESNNSSSSRLRKR
jgi:Holliday junction resolvase RusA-like endonuclease